MCGRVCVRLYGRGCGHGRGSGLGRVCGRAVLSFFFKKKLLVLVFVFGLQVLHFEFFILVFEFSVLNF